MTFIDELERLYNERGAARYEPGCPGGVSQLQHALQCAALAADALASPSLVVAALLHDLGHLLSPASAGGLADGLSSGFAGSPDDGLDDAHQITAPSVLRPHFPPAVLEPIRLHVDAKRYLCAVERGYWAELSTGSQHSLALQGGPFDSAQVAAFVATPYAEQAVWLRRWDDRAKDPRRRVLPFADYRSLLAQLATHAVADA